MNPLETYLAELRDIRSTGAAVAETSFYAPLSNLLNEIGKTLSPRSFASSTLPIVGPACPTPACSRRTRSG